MYIVKENDEDKINKAAEFVAERSRKLADAIELILALREDKELSVEDIEQAIDVVDGKKKLIDMVPYRALGFAPGRREKRTKDNMVAYMRLWASSPFERNESETSAFDFLINSYCYRKPRIHAGEEKSYIGQHWNLSSARKHFEVAKMYYYLAKKEEPERGMICVRNR